MANTNSGVRQPTANGSASKRWPAGQVLSDALIGLQLGFLPYKIKVAIAELAETLVIFVGNARPNLPALFRRIEELVHLISLAEHKEGWLSEMRKVLTRTRKRVRPADLVGEFAGLNRSWETKAREEATSHRWRGDSRYLQAYLAVHPELDREQWERTFEQAYRESLGSGEQRAQGRRGTSKPRGKKVPQPQMNLPNARTQWDIARFVAKGERRKSIVGEEDAVLAGIRAVLAGATPAVRYWAEIGELLGRTLWTSWCPVPDEFHEYFPRSMSDFAGHPELAEVEGAAILEKWRRDREAEILQDRSGIDENDPQGMSQLVELAHEKHYVEERAWTGCLAAWSLAKFESFISILGRMKEAVGDVDGLRLSKNVPPAVVAQDDGGCVVLGQQITVTPGRNTKIIRALQEAFPDSLDLGQLESLIEAGGAANYVRRLRKDALWESVLAMPGGKGRGGYRLAWPT